MVHSEYERFGSTTDYVIHSGDSYPVCCVKYSINFKNQNDHDIQDLDIEYEIAAEGLPLISGTKNIAQATFMKCKMEIS